LPSTVKLAYKLPIFKDHIMFRYSDLIWRVIIAHEIILTVHTHPSVLLFIYR